MVTDVKITGRPVGQLADNSGKTGDATKGEVVREFEKVDSYYHDPDTDGN